MEDGAVLEADQAADIEEVQAWAAGLSAPARPHRGTVAPVDNCQLGVFLAYASPGGGR